MVYVTSQLMVWKLPRATWPSCLSGDSIKQKLLTSQSSVLKVTNFPISQFSQIFPNSRGKKVDWIGKTILNVFGNSFFAQTKALFSGKENKKNQRPLWREFETWVFSAEGVTVARFQSRAKMLFNDILWVVQLRNSEKWQESLFQTIEKDFFLSVLKMNASSKYNLSHQIYF